MKALSFLNGHFFIKPEDRSNLNLNAYNLTTEVLYLALWLKLAFFVVFKFTLPGFLSFFLSSAFCLSLCEEPLIF